MNFTLSNIYKAVKAKLPFDSILEAAKQIVQHVETIDAGDQLMDRLMSIQNTRERANKWHSRCQTAVEETIVDWNSVHRDKLFSIGYNETITSFGITKLTLHLGYNKQSCQTYDYSFYHDTKLSAITTAKEGLYRKMLNNIISVGLLSYTMKSDERWCKEMLSYEIEYGNPMALNDARNSPLLTRLAVLPTIHDNMVEHQRVSEVEQLMRGSRREPIKKQGFNPFYPLPHTYTDEEAAMMQRAIREANYQHIPVDQLAQSYHIPYTKETLVQRMLREGEGKYYPSDQGKEFE